MLSFDRVNSIPSLPSERLAPGAPTAGEPKRDEGPFPKSRPNAWSDPDGETRDVSTSIDPQTIPDYTRFAIGFDDRDRARLHALIDEVLDSNRWAEGSMNARFEAAWEESERAPGGRAEQLDRAARCRRCDFAGVGRGDTVLCPSNTFMATPLAAIRAGAEVQFVDCNREDLCMSFADFERRAEQHKPKAAFLVHIGGHIAFDSEQIAAYCAEHGIFLIEDCAHAHGACWHGRKPGSFGDAGVYSMYATKTVSTGEGGVLVSKRPELLEHARAFRNYGKPSYEVQGLNFRMSEFTAALGLIQVERLPEIVAWKNEIARTDLDPRFPQAASSSRTGWSPGFTSTSSSTGSSAPPGVSTTSPATGSWATTSSFRTPTGWRRNHSCPPLYYRPLGERRRDRSMRVLVTGGSGFIGSHVVDKLRAHGHEPVIYDLRSSPWHDDGTVETVIGSITDRAALERAMADCDAVAHLAAVADVNDVHAEPEDAEHVNSRGTAAVLEAARRAGVNRVVYASTIWVYSDTESVEVDEDNAAASAEPPVHQHQARGRAVLQVLPRAVWDRLHDPALRNPVRPARSRGGGDPGVRQQGVGRRTADAGGGRNAVAPVRLRRGPGGGCGAGAERGRCATACTT